MGSRNSMSPDVNSSREHGDEFVLEEPGGAEAVRLEHRKHARGEQARGTDGCADLFRVVGVIVDDADAVLQRDNGKPALHALVFRRGAGQGRPVAAERVAHAQRGQQVRQVVRSGQRKGVDDAARAKMKSRAQWQSPCRARSLPRDRRCAARRGPRAAGHRRWQR